MKIFLYSYTFIFVLYFASHFWNIVTHSVPTGMVSCELDPLVQSSSFCTKNINAKYSVITFSTQSHLCYLLWYKECFDLLQRLGFPYIGELVVPYLQPSCPPTPSTSCQGRVWHNRGVGHEYFWVMIWKVGRKVSETTEIPESVYFWAWTSKTGEASPHGAEAKARLFLKLPLLHHVVRQSLLYNINI